MAESKTFGNFNNHHANQPGFTVPEKRFHDDDAKGAGSPHADDEHGHHGGEESPNRGEGKFSKKEREKIMKPGLASSSVKFVVALLIGLNLAAFTAASELKAISLAQNDRFTFGPVYAPSVGFTLNKAGRFEIKQNTSLDVAYDNINPKYAGLYNKWNQDSKRVPVIEGFKLERAYVKRSQPEILNFNTIGGLAPKGNVVVDEFNRNFAFVNTITDGELPKGVFGTFARNQQLNRYEVDFYKFERA